MTGRRVTTDPSPVAYSRDRSQFQESEMSVQHLSTRPFLRLPRECPRLSTMRLVFAQLLSVFVLGSHRICPVFAQPLSSHYP